MMDVVTNAVNHASQQDDRWLFLALLACGLVGAVFLWRFMVSERETMGRRLTEVTDRHIAQGERLSEVVANNTVALREVKGVLEGCHEFRRHGHVRKE